MSSESDYESLSRPSGLRSAAALCHREIVRFARQRNRVIGALGQPVLFWLLFGAGLHGAFRIDEDGPTFWEYYFPGTIVLILLFTAIFATISIIEDRREGFLQSVLVAPSPRWSMVLGKVLGGTILAVGQALLFLGVGWAVGLRPPLANVAWLVLMLFITAFGLTSFGFVLAWRMQSTQGFHAIMNLLL
ncbi:MAG: ABC transporter permease, partial [Pirellulaceae bacterium]|nr:ABC transporter permease [Pirellulaceae bacterium]